MKKILFLLVTIVLAHVNLLAQLNVTNLLCGNKINAEDEPVKKQETFKPLKFITTPEGDKAIDIGQNFYVNAHFFISYIAKDNSRSICRKSRELVQTNTQ